MIANQHSAKSEIVYCRPLNVDFTGILKVDLGVDNALNYSDIIYLLSFNRIKYDRICSSVLYSYLGKHKGYRVKTLFHLLQCIVSHPYRNLSTMHSYMGMEFSVISKSLKLLLELKLISVVKRPRKLMMLNSYTMDNTYIVTKSGKRLMQSVYEEVGLM